MSPTVRLSRAAETDLDEIWFYIAQDSVSAADRFIELLTGKFPRLAATPSMDRARDELQPGLRSFPVKRYLILYRPIENGVEIVRVTSGYRDLSALLE